MKLLKFTDYDSKRPVWINPEQVMSVSGRVKVNQQTGNIEQRYTHIMLMASSFYHVTEDTELVVGLISSELADRCGRYDRE